jgi:enoyl-CoA hydratase/carnithine racemase
LEEPLAAEPDALGGEDFTSLHLSEPEPGTLLVTMDRPPMNAMTVGMLAELKAVAEMAEANPAIRCIVITGNGRAFSAGADMSEFERMFAEQGEAQPLYFRYATKVGLLAFETLPKPVISAINGAAVGEGLEVAMCSDFRIVARSARLGFPEGNIGLIPASGGCSRIVKLIGLARAKELVLLGEMLDGEAAERVGLAWKVVDDDDLLDTALDLARRLAKKAPLALGMAKAVLRTSAEVDMTSAHTLEMVAQTVLTATRDHEEGVEAFRAKRPPAFESR